MKEAEQTVFVRHDCGQKAKKARVSASRFYKNLNISSHVIRQLSYLSVITEQGALVPALVG